MPVPEVLAPAGTPAKLRAALHFGADAAYLGLERYSLRAMAGNFSWDELEWALGYAHERGRRIYVALNVLPFDVDLEGLEQTLRRLATLGPDAVIVADPGVLAMARRLAPDVPVHLSTQTSVSNAAAARFWFAQGVRRIVVARELSLPQLASVAAGAGGQIEAFVHGAVCIAYSGRCFLSLYWAPGQRDPRSGSCAQGCRWPYRSVGGQAIEDRLRPGQANPIEQDERGTYFFDAKDMCALPVLDEMMATGVRALKIEGRSRSAYYVGVTVDVYRHAVDRLAAGDLAGFRAAREAYEIELARAARRGFSTHFLTGDQDRAEAYNPEGSKPDGRAEYVGDVTRNTGDELWVAVTNPVRPGVPLQIRDRGLACEEIAAPSLRGEGGEPLEMAHRGRVVRLAGRFSAQPGALVRLRDVP